MYFVIGMIILPVVMLLGALHFVMLGMTKLFRWKRAEVTTFRHLIALDVYANTLLGGDPKETISSRLGRNQDCLFCGWICSILNIFDKDHCQKAASAFLKDKQKD